MRGATLLLVTLTLLLAGCELRFGPVQLGVSIVTTMREVRAAEFARASSDRWLFRNVADTSELATIRTSFLRNGTIAQLADGSEYYFNATAGTGGVAGRGPGRWWLLAPNGTALNVQTFGAVGDGATDDTKAIQNALNAGLDVFFPATENAYLISDSLIFDPTLRIFGSNPKKTKIRMTNSSKWAFIAQPLPDVTPQFNGSQANGGCFSHIDLRARFGLRIGSPNFADPPTYEYRSFTELFANSPPIQHFEVNDCIFYSDFIYRDALAYILASPNVGTANPPTFNELFERGCGVLFSNVYRGMITDCEIKLFGCGVWLYGSDLSTVQNCRLANNLRHVHLQATHSAGFQCHIQRNDLLANYRYGGVYIIGNHQELSDNYFENTGEPTNSIINYYIVNRSAMATITRNRFDDYGSNRTTGPLVVFGGAGGSIVSLNRVADNRPCGIGERAKLSVDTTAYNPSATPYLNNWWGMVNMAGNDATFPLLSHPMAQYNLDDNALFWAPLRTNQRQSFQDISGGGNVNSMMFAQDAIGIWYFNASPKSIGIVMPVPEERLNPSLAYKVKIKARCLDPVGLSAFVIIKWVDARGSSMDLFAAPIAFSDTVNIHVLTRVVSIPAMSLGRFVISIDQTQADLYSIEIVES